MGIVIANDRKSLAGIEYHTPSNSQNRGNTYAIGNRRNSWRDSDRNIDTFTFPILWKKWVIVACDPTTKNTSISSFMPRADSSISVSSVVNMRAIWRGNSIDSPQPTSSIAVAHPIARNSHRSIRSYFSAP